MKLTKDPYDKSKVLIFCLSTIEKNGAVLNRTFYALRESAIERLRKIKATAELEHPVISTYNDLDLKLERIETKAGFIYEISKHELNQ